MKRQSELIGNYKNQRIKSLQDNIIGASFIGGAKSWSVSCDGQFITDDAGQKALMEAFVAGENVTIEMKNADDTVYFGGTAAITSVEVEAAFDDVCTMSLELQGVGELNLTKGE